MALNPPYPEEIISLSTNKTLHRVYYYHNQPVGSYQITQKKQNKRIIIFRPNNIIDESHQIYELLYEFIPNLIIENKTFIIEIGLNENPYAILNSISWVVTRCGDLVHQVQRLQREVDKLTKQIEEMQKSE